MKTVIITGAGGFVGTELTKKMIKNGIKVLALSLEFSESFPQSSLIERIEMDISDSQQVVDRIPEGDYEAFYHLAWIGVNGPQKTDPYIQLNNTRIALNCVSIAKKLGCKKILFAGTIAERSSESLSYLDKTSGGMLYGVTKHCTHLLVETYCKNIGQPFVWMQFSNIFGPQNKTGNLVSYTLGEIINGREAQFGPAQQPYDFIYVDDLIEAVFRLGFCAVYHTCYFIGSGTPKILSSYLQEIGNIYGKPELIKIGARPDDGIKYEMDMFDNSMLVKDIGQYVTKSFHEHIQYTIENYQRGEK